MTSQPGLQVKTFVLISLIIVLTPLGNTFLGKGMKQMPAMTSWAPADLFHFFFKAMMSGAIWIGIALMLAYFIVYLLVLSFADYSFVQPACSASYVLISLLAHFMLHESISPVRWVGVAVICAGVFVVGRTAPRTPEHHSW